jgi:hypothetical protein
MGQPVIYGFGRVPSPEDRRDFKMADAVTLLEKAPTPRPNKLWHSDKVLFQGNTPHCVGFSWAAWGIAAPVEDPWCDLTGHDIYKACKVLDGEPGAQNGSTVRTGAKVMKNRNRIGTYFFAHSIDEAADYVARFGAVVLGTNWTEGMCKPSLINKIISPTGKVVGGHAYLWIGVDRVYATLLNSWGTTWGKGGYARIKLSDLAALFADRGEACAATEMPLSLGGK